MKNLTKDETINMKGGAISVWAAAGIGLILVFAIGVFKGYTNPQKCK